MGTELRYRLLEDRDLPGVFRLWKREGWAWSARRFVLWPSQSNWRRWYTARPPEGSRITVVGVDDQGRIAAHLEMRPSRVVVGDREVSALRLSAPVLRADLRRRKLVDPNHPFVRLLAIGKEEAEARGYSLLYSHLQRGWLHILEWTEKFGICRFEGSAFPSMRLLPRGAARIAGPAALATRRAEAFGEEYDELWEAARRTFPIACGVVRDAKWLRWRHGRSRVIEARDPADGSLVGYACFRKQGRLLTDLLARTPEELAPVLASAIRRWWRNLGWLLTRERTVLQVMETPFLGPTLRTLGLEPYEFRFAFASSALDPTLPRQAIAPESWYLTADE